MHASHHLFGELHEQARVLLSWHEHVRSLTWSDRVDTWQSHIVATPDLDHAELNTILLELKLAADLRDISCIIVSDVKNLVHWICNKDSVLSWRVAYVVYECCTLLQDNTRGRLKFESRSTNKAAHYADRQCLNQNTLIVNVLINYLISVYMNIFLLFC